MSTTRCVTDRRIPLIIRILIAAGLDVLAFWVIKPVLRPALRGR